MSFLGFGKNKKVIDLTESYKRQAERLAQKKQVEKEKEANAAEGMMPFSFFNSETTVTTVEEDDASGTSEDKRKRLTKRIMDMTERLEDISNQLYHLQQRLEVLERKMDIRRE